MGSVHKNEVKSTLVKEFLFHSLECVKVIGIFLKSPVSECVNEGVGVVLIPLKLQYGL